MMKQITILLLTVLLFISSALNAQEEGKINKEGIELGEKKQYDKAIEKFNRAIKNYDNNSARLYHNKAWAEQEKGDFGEAIKNYEEAFKRNPKQVVSGENLGFIYYNSKDYENAVRVGEDVLKQDPANREVKKWLPDAYLKRLEARRLKELEQKNKDLDEERRKQLAKEKQDEDKEKQESRKLLVTFDFMLRTGYYMTNNRYKFITDKGLITNVPETLFTSFTPTRSWEFTATLENPYLGAQTPPGIIIHSEIFEGMYKLDNYMLGLGLMFNHYYTDVAFDRQLVLWDIKVGLLFGYIKDKVEMRFTFYPRLLPYDGSYMSGNSLDVAMFRIDYTYRLSNSMRIYSLISFKDFFVFNHTDRMSDYWGVYDIGLGATLGRMLRFNSRRDFSFSMEFILRFYLRDLENTDPYTRAPNGQGYFGLNMKKWLSGGAFSGFHTLGYVFGFRVDEEILDYLFLYQKFILELGDEHDEFNFQFGLGVTY